MGDGKLASFAKHVPGKTCVHGSSSPMLRFRRTLGRSASTPAAWLTACARVSEAARWLGLGMGKGWG